MLVLSSVLDQASGESVSLFRQASGSWRVRLLQITTIKVTRTSCGTHDLFGGLLNILRKMNFLVLHKSVQYLFNISFTRKGQEPALPDEGGIVTVLGFQNLWFCLTNSSSAGGVRADVCQF